MIISLGMSLYTIGKNIHKKHTLQGIKQGILRLQGVITKIIIIGGNTKLTYFAGGKSLLTLLSWFSFLIFEILCLFKCWLSICTKGYYSVDQIF
jgi:hypothetical protein